MAKKHQDSTKEMQLQAFTVGGISKTTAAKIVKMLA
jgi:hypothetical protein